MHVRPGLDDRNNQMVLPRYFAFVQAYDPNFLEVSDGTVQRLTDQSPYGNKA